MVNDISPAVVQQVEQAVKQAEAKTSGEIRVAMVRRADPRSPLVWVGVGVLGGLLSIAIVWYRAWGVLSLADVLESAGLAAAVGVGLAFLDSRRSRVRRVRTAAERMFAELGIAGTSGRTGVLLFVALAEHRVELLADRAINEKVAAGTWDGVVAGLITQLKAGQLGPGVSAAVEALGTTLGQHLPRQAGDVNELPDAPVVR